MQVLTIEKARLSLSTLQAGDQIAYLGAGNTVRLGTVKFKRVACNQNSRNDRTHRIYAYAQCRIGPKVTEKYIGVIK